MLGDWLYTLSDMEARSAPVMQRVTARVPVPLTAAAVLFGDTFTVPADKLFILKNLSLDMTAGAAQTVSRAQWFLNPDVGTTALLNIAEQSYTTPLLQTNQSWFINDLVMMPGEKLQAIVTFNAGGAANKFVPSAYGLLLPKGTLQLR